MKKKMRRRLVALIGTASLCMPVSLPAQTVELQNALRQLYETAQGHNASLQSTQAAINQANAGIESARMSKLPDVSAQVSFSYLGNARLWNRKFGESTKAAMPHYGNNFLLHAEQVLYAGGAIKGGIALAEQNAQMAKLTATDETQRIRYSLVSLFLQLHALRNQQTVYATNRELATTQIELMKKRREKGVSLRNDITRYELQLQQIDLGETSVIDQQSILHKQLMTAIGTDSASVPLLNETAFNDEAVSVGTEADWQQIALQQHLGLQKSSLAVDMSRTQEKITRAERLPKVALIAEDHLDGPITIEVPPINKNLNYWYIGVGISYNFSSLYKTKRKLREAQLGTTLAETQHNTALQGVSDAVHAAYVNFGTAQTELATCEKSVQLATENYDVVAKRYQNGLALVTDLTDAANMKLDAELALANARINLVFRFYGLKYATNTL